jgi:hypothetical protein
MESPSPVPFVKRHGGSIEVDTEPGELAEIRVILPRASGRGHDVALCFHESRLPQFQKKDRLPENGTHIAGN